MTLFGDMLGVSTESYDIKSLAANSAEEVDASPVSIAANDTQAPTQLEEFDSAYRKDPQVFQSINAKVQTIMSAGYELRCDDDPTGKILEYFNEFLDTIGDVGEESTWEEVLDAIYYSQMKYGKHSIETVYNKKQNKIVDLATLDSKNIDFARNEKGNIVFNKYGRPIGYSQQLPYSIDVSQQGDPVPKEVTLKMGQIFLLPKRIAYFWLYGDKLNPIGLIEPGYQSIIRKMKIQEGQANSIYQRGLFPIIDYIGSPERFPTPKMIQNATSKLKMMQHNRYFAFPYWHNIKPLEVSQSNVVDNTIKSLKEDIAASLGMPLPFAMSVGEAVNRATLLSQQRFLEYSLRDIVKRTIASIKKNIFKRISLLEGFKTKKGKLIVPYMVWGDIGVGSKDDKMDRLSKSLKAGGITPEYVMPYVIKSEGLYLDKNLKIKNPAKEKKPSKEKNSKKELSSIKSSNFSYNDLDEILGRL